MLQTILHQLGRVPSTQTVIPTSVEYAADNWHNAFAQLQALYHLEDDWDGQGAEAPKASNLEAAVAWARRMQSSLLPPSRIIAGVCGEVSFLWQTADFYLEGEIDTPTKIERLLSIPGQAVEQWETRLATPPVPAS